MAENLVSRAWFVREALATNALVAASHFPTLGHLAAADNWLTWQPQAEEER